MRTPRPAKTLGHVHFRQHETEEGGGDSFTVHAEVCTHVANGVGGAGDHGGAAADAAAGPAYVGPDGTDLRAPGAGVRQRSYYPQSQPCPGQHTPPPA